MFLLVGGVIWAARGVLLPYIMGLVLAYILLPLVNWLDRHMPAKFHTWRIARPLAIALTYLLLFIVVAGVVAFFVPLVYLALRRAHYLTLPRHPRYLGQHPTHR